MFLVAMAITQKNGERFCKKLIHTNFPTRISLFYYCKKVFTHMNTGIVGRNLIKPHSLKKVMVS